MLQLLKAGERDPGATVPHGSSCAGQAHKAGAEDCLTPQALRPTRRGAGSCSSPAAGLLRGHVPAGSSCWATA